MISRLAFSLLLLLAPFSKADVEIDVEALGESLGGWKKSGATAEYDLSGASYRTFKPEVTPTPEGGIFVSLRIDHRRGWLSSNDHAVLEITVGEDGSVLSAQSSLAIQGRTIASDLIRGTADAGAILSGAEGAVKIGTDLVADLSGKLLREKVVEAGRVNYPAAIRHNYNLLFQAIRTHPKAILPAEVGDESAPAATHPAAAGSATSRVPAGKLEIKSYGDDGKRR